MKNKNKVQVKNLFPGQVVSVQGFREYGTVVSREDKNVYVVKCEDKEFRISRIQLGVNVDGIFMFGPRNTTDLPA